MLVRRLVNPFVLKGLEHRVLGRKVLVKNIIYKLVPDKKYHVESLTLKHIITTYLKHVKCMKTEVNLFFPMDKNMISPPFCPRVRSSSTVDVSLKLLDFGKPQIIQGYTN